MALGRKRGSVSPIVYEADAPQQPIKLSEREKELAHLAASGHSNAEIADQLSLSLSTVKWHLQRVFTKLSIERRSQLSLFSCHYLDTFTEKQSEISQKTIL